jgi:hypothetical protein
MPLDHNALLMGAFGTTEAEVEQLRDGKLPEKQHKRLWQRSFAGYALWSTMMIILAIFQISLNVRLFNTSVLLYGLRIEQVIWWSLLERVMHFEKSGS